ncbi:hypothetical protein J1N09_10080 [Aureitalea sp. L0-47]|uniref:hypothetical protein n=1 Tax=Aureitalea sp. L0-47 TaxID=2816962 RepID=UPI002238E546|nr:hypothetical protein [Aureitalea sp. L0-47]MCW5520186.1 hypothetical protein [Aureitalea sp. L0-47]
MNRKERRELKRIVKKEIRQLVCDKEETGMVNLSDTYIKRYSTIITNTLVNFQYKSSKDFFETIYIVLGVINDFHETIIPNYNNVEILRLSDECNCMEMIIKK